MYEGRSFVYGCRSDLATWCMDERFLAGIGAHRVPLVIGCLDAMPPPAGSHESDGAGGAAPTFAYEKAEAVVGVTITPKKDQLARKIVAMLIRRKRTAWREFSAYSRRHDADPVHAASRHLLWIFASNAAEISRRMLYGMKI